MSTRVLASSYGDESVRNCSDVSLDPSDDVVEIQTELKQEQPPCEDESFDLPCESYMNMDFCMLPFVSKKCTKTCEFCGMEGSDNGGICKSLGFVYIKTLSILDFVPCPDYDSNCSAWKEEGLCKSIDFGEWVTRVCPKSCTGC